MTRAVLVLPILLAACARPPQSVDPQLASEIAEDQGHRQSRASRAARRLAGEKPDDEYDALPVEIARSRNPIPFATRPGSPILLEAHRAIFGGDKAGRRRRTVRITPSRCWIS